MASRPRIWSSTGHITVAITDQLIEAAKVRSSSHCAIADALRALHPDIRHPSADLATIRFSYRDTRYLILTPRRAQRFIVGWDRGEAVEAFTMHLRPDWIVSAKKKNQAPDDGELKAAGLDHIKASKRQLHIPPPTQRFTETGKRNLDPNRSDGLAPPPPQRELITPLPKKRESRRRLATPSSKGSIPCVLGGKLPPINGGGSRREYGIRMLPDSRP